MKIFDVTRELSEKTPVFPGDPSPVITEMNCGEYVITELQISSHCGTHIDAPSHFIRGGLTVDRIPPEILIGDACVLDCTGIRGPVGVEDLLDRIGGVRRLLLKTRSFPLDEISPDFSCLTAEAARYLVAQGILCLGIDTPSVDSFEGDGIVHRLLLGSGTVIIEMLDLSGVLPGTYHMIALPLRLKGGDGSPARVLLCEKL